MNRSYPHLTCILLMAAIAMSVQAQLDNAPVNGTIENATLVNTTRNISLNLSAHDISDVNYTALNNTALNGTALNLSTVNGKIPDIVTISEIAGKAPAVSATASSAQTSSQPEGAVLLGPEIGGLDPFNPIHAEINPAEIGMPIKPLRNTSDMVFVCDIV